MLSPLLFSLYPYLALPLPKPPVVPLLPLLLALVKSERTTVNKTNPPFGIRDEWPTHNGLTD